MRVSLHSNSRVQIMEKDEGGSYPHVVVIPQPIQGHINPMFQFSKRLAMKGLKLTFLKPTNTTNPIHAQTNGSIKIHPISDGSERLNKNDIEDFDAYMKRSRSSISQSIDEFIEKAKRSDSPPKILVYDSCMPWALDIAQKHGIQGAAFFTQPCAVCAIYYHVHQGEVKIPIEVDKISMPSMPQLDKFDFPSFVYDTVSYTPALKILADQFSNFTQANWLLFNTFNDLEEEIFNWMASQWPIKTIGPTIPSMYLDKRLKDDNDYGLNLFEPNIDECMKWLDNKEKGSVVYVAFGSLAALGQEHMKELAWGLRRSESNFLWVVRESEWEKLPSNFVEETLEKGLVVTWCHQLNVLAHKAIGCFVTHCGWNSTLEALSLGVPMVAMPQWTDQPTNAKFIVDVWQVGVRVKVDEDGIGKQEEIEMCIREVMEGERGKEIKMNASRWKELAKEAMDEGGSSDKNIEEFVKHLISQNLNEL